MTGDEAKRNELSFSPAAGRQVRGLDRKVQERIKAATEQLRDDPWPNGVKALTNLPGALRIRVGDWRVVYRVESDRLVVLVIAVGHRREIYR